MALTAQNTTAVTAVHVLRELQPRELERRSTASASTPRRPDALLVGAHRDRRRVPRARPVPLVVDPVMVARSGARLLQPDAVQTLVARLFPLATVATPNLWRPGTHRPRPGTRATWQSGWSSSEPGPRSSPAAMAESGRPPLRRPGQPELPVRRNDVPPPTAPAVRTPRRWPPCSPAACAAGRRTRRRRRRAEAVRHGLADTSRARARSTS